METTVELTKYSSAVEIQYRLNYLYQAFDDYAMANSGEIDEAIDEEIQLLESFLENRVEYYVDSIADMQDSILGIKGRIAKLNEEIKQKERMIVKKTEAIENLNGREPVTTSKHAFKWTKSKKTVVDPLLLADVEAGNAPEYLLPFVKREEKVTYKLPLAPLKKAIDAGEELEGVEIVDSFTAKVE